MRILFFLLLSSTIYSQTEFIECLSFAEYDENGYVTPPVGGDYSVTRHGVLYINTDTTFLEFPLQVGYKGDTLNILDQDNNFIEITVSNTPYGSADSIAAILRHCYSNSLIGASTTGDNYITNELITYYSIQGDTLMRITEAGQNWDVSMSRYLDNTDVQDLTRTGDSLYLSGDPTNNGVSIKDGDYMTNNEVITNFNIHGDTLLRINEAGSTWSVNVKRYLDNTDAQILSFSGDTLYLTNGSQVYLGGYIDPEYDDSIIYDSLEVHRAAINTNRTNIATNVTNIGTNTSDIAAHEANGLSINSPDTAMMDITHGSKTSRVVYKVITNAGILLASPSDVEDNQQITDLSLSGDSLSITIENGNTQTVVLTGISGSPDIEEQTISTNTMTVAMEWPTDPEKYIVFLKESGISLQEITTPVHAIQYSRSGNIITFYENLDNEIVVVRRIN